MKLFKKILAISSAFAMLLNLPSTSIFASDVTFSQLPYAAYSDIALPETDSEGATITWSSDMPSVIGIDGTVTRPSAEEESKIVTLTATSENGVSEYKILVPHMGKTYFERFFSDFTDNKGLDFTSLANGEVSYLNDNGTSYMLLENTESNVSTVTIILDEAVGVSGSTDVELRLKPCASSNFMFYSEEGYAVARSQMHSSGGFMVAVAGTGTQKNIGNKGDWLTAKYNFAFDSETPANSTFSLTVNDAEKYPANTEIYHTDASSIGTNIKKICISSYRTAADADPSGTAVDSIRITEDIEGDTDALVQAAYNSLVIENADNITSNIELPTLINGCEVIWASSDETVVKSDGTAYLPSEGQPSKNAELTAFIILADSIMEKKFDITLNPYVDNSLTEAADSVDIPLLITDDIVLPEFGSGISATFISDYSDILSSDGKITRPTQNSTYVPFKIRYEKGTDFIEREYETVVAKEIPFLKMNIEYENFEGITDPTDALYYINSGGESHGEAKFVTDDISGSTVLSSKITGSNYSPEFRFKSYYGKVVIEFDARMMCNTGTFAYIYGDGICSSMTLGNNAITVRGATESITFLNNISPDEWYHFKILIDTTPFTAGNGDCTTDIWVDGVKCVTGLKTRANSTMINRILTAPSSTDGEIRYDNLMVYTDYSESVESAAQTLELIGADAVLGNYPFPARTENGMDIEFVSKEPQYITSTGKVTRPNKYEDDKQVEVYAIIYKDMFMSIKPFEMTILHQYSDSVSVEKDVEALSLGDLSDVRSDLVLSTTGSNGTIITWESSDEKTISTQGKVNRPGYIKDERYKEVVLTATVKKGNESETKTFTAYVAENNFAEDAYVRVDTEDSVHSAVYINDEDYNTYWKPQTSGESTIVVDLGNSRLVNRCEIITRGTVNNVRVSYSQDTSKYHNLVASEQSDGKIVFDFDEKALRYIKIVANFADNSGISEIELYHYLSEESLIKKDIADLKKLNLTNLKSDISLPTEGSNGSEIIWVSSSNADVLNTDGTVSRKDDTVKVTLTATLKIGTVSETITLNASVAGLSSGGGSTGGGSSTGRESVDTPLFSNNFVQSSNEQNNNIKGDKGAFDDLKGYDWAKNAIEELYKNGILNGRADRVFMPGENVTRAEFVKLLCSVINVGEGSADFIDVSDSDWFAPYVKSATSAGWIFGYEGRFNPNQPITRQDMAVIIARALNLETLNNPEFNDSKDIADYALSAVASLTERKIMQGYDGNFAPLKVATRAEAAMVAYSIYMNR